MRTPKTPKFNSCSCVHTERHKHHQSKRILFQHQKGFQTLIKNIRITMSLRIVVSRTFQGAARRSFAPSTSCKCTYTCVSIPMFLVIQTGTCTQLAPPTLLWGGKCYVSDTLPLRGQHRSDAFQKQFSVTSVGHARRRYKLEGRDLPLSSQKLRHCSSEEYMYQPSEAC